MNPEVIEKVKNTTLESIAEDRRNSTDYTFNDYTDRINRFIREI